MDEINNKIVKQLRENSRTPFLKIAKQLNVSEGTIRQRVKKLLNKGVIQRFTVELNLDASAIVGVITSSEVPTSRIIEKIRELNKDSISILDINEVAGKYTLFIKIQSDNLKGINEKLELIRSIRGVIQTETFPILGN